MTYIDDQYPDEDTPFERFVTMTEIAELAGVRRPTVSNWRRRHRGFPHPSADDGTQPLFEVNSVAAWLDGRAIPAATSAPKTYGERFREELRIRAVADLRIPGLSGDRLLIAGVALCALRQLTGKPVEEVPTAQRFARKIEQERSELAGLLTADIDGLKPNCRPLINAVEDMCRAAATDRDDPIAANPVAVAERLLAEADRLGAGLRAEMTPKAVADFVAGLVGNVDGRTVYDPAAGSGSLLLRLLEDGTPARLVAADSDGPTFRLLRQRFLLHGVAAEMLRQDSLRSGTWHDVEVVVVDPPFMGSDDHATASRGPFSWLRYAQGQLGFGGRAAVVLPAWTLNDSGRPGLFARRWKPFLESGALRAVVQLPRRAHSFRTGTELAVVVLERNSDRSPTRDVLLCHAERGSGDPCDVARLVRDWLSEEQHDLPPHIAREISADDALRSGSLLPSRFLAAAEPDLLGRAIAAGVSRLGDLPVLDRVRLPSAIRRRPPRGHTSVGEHVEAKLLEFLSGQRLGDAEIRVSGEIEVIGPAELTGDCPLGSRRIKREQFERSGHRHLTAPGDVVVLPADPPLALVDSSGDRLVQSPVQVLRVHREWITPRVLAAVLTAPRNAVRAGGSLVRRVDLTTLEIPDLPYEEVRRVDEVLRMLDAHRQQAADRLSALEDLITALGAGVADGTLSVVGTENSEMREHGGTA